MLKSIFILGVVLFFSSPFAYGKEPTLADLAIQKGAIVKRLAEVQATVNSCKRIDNRIGSRYQCDTWGLNNETEQEFNAMKKDVKTLETALESVNAKISLKRGDSKLEAAAAKGDVAGMPYDAKMLMLDYTRFKAEVASIKGEMALTQGEINGLMTRLDKSVLGEYTRYAIEQSLKSSSNTKRAICQIAAACGESKALNSKVNEIESKLKSIDDFRRERAEAARAAAPPAVSQESETGASAK